MVREGEEEDELIRIAKIWGCTCRPRIIRCWTQGDLLRGTLRHDPSCRYDPESFFRPAEVVDEEEIAANAERMKKARQKANRKYTTKRGK